ncbi:MAG: hypothetical protein EXR99_04750 [Gemmataceae bacterium]|nr:hypothetical protein [Gemmataceae bacterium]
MVGLALVAFAGVSRAADPLPKEEDYYKIVKFEFPKDVVLEPGGMALTPDGKLMVSSRRGEIWTVENPFAADLAKDAKWTRYAHGLHEVLGLALKDDWVYATQRGELSRLKDSKGAGKADKIETVNDAWEITGDYHEYAFGSHFDKEGNIWIVLCLTGSFNSNCKYRGWCVRVTPEGKLIPTCSGIRSPGGIGFNSAGDCFYTDNQGPWNGTSSLKHLLPGSFQGHPDGNRWFEEAKESSILGKRPETPKSNSRMMVEAARIPQLMPPAIYFPYKKMGQSASGIDFDSSGGKFGPFQNQLFVADQTNSTVMRVCLEKVNGRYQGACIPFRKGFGSGNVPILFSKSGHLFVGGTNRGWGSHGNKPFALERLDWTGKVPFEVHEMKARSDGFDLTFTQTVDPKTAADLASYKISTYCYIYQAAYGSPEVDFTYPNVVSATVGADKKSVRLVIDKPVAGHIHELVSAGVRSEAGLPLLHPEAYYTLNYLPSNNP